MIKAVRKIDAAIYRAERLVAGALFLLMALVMFANVVQRIYSRPDGRLAAAILHFAGRAHAQAINGPVSLALNIAVTFLLSYAALRTMKLARPLGRGPALGLAAAATGGLVGVVKLVLVLFPNGVVFAPPFCLSCMLWVGFLGASMATFDKRHLALEMGDKIWPKKISRHVRGLAMLATAACCGVLLVLSYRSVRIAHHDWTINHLVGNLLPTSIPKWAVFLIFPYTFLIMMLRFVGLVAAKPEDKAESEKPPS